jgi:hypothetical protein
MSYIWRFYENYEKIVEIFKFQLIAVISGNITVEL